MSADSTPPHGLDVDTQPMARSRPGLDHDEITQTSLPTIRATLERVVRDRERQRAGAWGKAIAGMVASGALLLGMGVTWEQSRQTSRDVGQVLVAVARLSQQSATVNARLDGLAQANADTRAALGDVQQKLWDARPMRVSGRHVVTAATVPREE